MDPSLVRTAARGAGDRLAWHRAPGHLVVLRHGRVVDRAFGADPTDLFLVYSRS